MKKIYFLLFFMVMVNVVSIMFVTMEIFPTEESSSNEYYQNVTETVKGEKIFYDISGNTFGDILGMFFGTASGLLGFLVTGLVSVAAAWLTHSPAPFVVGMIGGTFLTMYNSSRHIFDNYEMNGYIVLACSIGIVIIFIITCAEYLTQGDA